MVSSQVVGTLASDMPGEGSLLKGLLVRRNFSSALVHSIDLPTFSNLEAFVFTSAYLSLSPLCVHKWALLSHIAALCPFFFVIPPLPLFRSTVSS